jgi:hypothetical protein
MVIIEKYNNEKRYIIELISNTISYVYENKILISYLSTLKRKSIIKF